jgi:hypothetical protein
MWQTTIAHTGKDGTVRVAFTNAPHAELQPGEEVLVWVSSDGRLHSPVGTRPEAPPVTPSR